ncbi:hypothetical protein [Halococcus sp. PRR34]|uniref:hypothetical protein n=1 Tax=Halococcus sp. PRR34 TaxID=3020830 RepID=UPI002362EF97|nr:hypothetical protein [Halococcus sp. PRR34]
MVGEPAPETEIGETEEQSKNPGIKEAMDLYEKDDPVNESGTGNSTQELIIGNYPVADQLE